MSALAPAERARELLRQLCAASALPAEAGAEPGEVIALGHAMVEGRRPLLEELGAVLGPDRAAVAGDAEVDAMVARLRELDARWMSLMLRAKQTLSDNAAALSRLRQRRQAP